MGPATALGGVSDADLLVSAARSNDRPAFDELVRRTAPELFRTAYHLVHPSYVDDLVQDTYLKAWRSRTTYRQEAQPLTWLMRIMRNAAFDRHLRPTEKTEPIDDDLIVSESVNDIESFVLAEAIDQALAELVDWQAAIIRRRHLEGQTWATIVAGMAFRNEYYAKQAYALAKRNLARLLAVPPPVLGAP